MSTCSPSCAPRFRTEPERARQHVRLEHRLPTRSSPRLAAYPVTNRRNRQRPRLALHARFRDEHPPGPEAADTAPASIRQPTHRAVGPLRTPRPRPGWERCQCPVHPRLRAPRSTHATGRLCERPCPTAHETVGRDRPWPPGTAHAARHEPDLQGTNPAAAELVTWTPHRALPITAIHIDEAAAPSLTGGSMLSARLKRFLRPPPTPSRAGTSRITGYRARRSNTIRQVAGEGPLQFPPPPSIRCTPIRRA